MTTAHRPTWKAAVGKASEGGWTAGGAQTGHVATLSLASHTKLKTRQGAQIVDRKKALAESLLKLEQAEKKEKSKKSSIIGKRTISEEVEEEGRLRLLKQTAEVDDEAIRKKYNDEDADADDDDDSDGDDGGWNKAASSGGGGGGIGEDGGGDVDLDASSDEDDDSDDSDDDDSDEDDEEALQAELAKIRAEREAAKQKQQQEEDAIDEAKLEEAALLGNPLLNSTTGDGSGKLKRQWNDDVVFRNQAKGEPQTKKRFINDTVRNDFHKRFLNKFIR